MAFNLFKRKTNKPIINIYAPMDGKIIPLENIPDPVFSQKMMGEGIGIEPTNGKVYAPVDAKVIQVAPTKHAIGLLAGDGTEILIHIGLDTVNLKGEGFTVHVSQDQEVAEGELVLEFDLDYIKQHAPSTVTPIVITNSQNSDKTYEITNDTSAIHGETILIHVTS